MDVYGETLCCEPGDKFNHKVVAVICFLRTTLREEFLLPLKWNPVPCVERGRGGAWTLFIPADIDNGKSPK